MRRGELDMDQAAAASGFHPSHVCALAVMGRVKSRKAGYRRFIDAKDLASYVRKRGHWRLRDHSALFEQARDRLHDAVRLDMLESHHEAAAAARSVWRRR